MIRIGVLLIALGFGWIMDIWITAAWPTALPFVLMLIGAALCAGGMLKRIILIKIHLGGLITAMIVSAGLMGLNMYAFFAPKPPAGRYTGVVLVEAIGWPFYIYYQVSNIKMNGLRRQFETDFNLLALAGDLFFVIFCVIITYHITVRILRGPSVVKQKFLP